MPRFEPTPAGTLVTGRKPGYKAPRERCLGHIFVTRTAERNPMWRSGFQQGAWCLVCGDQIYPMDAAWWKELATEQDIASVRSYLRREAERFKLLSLWLKRQEVGGRTAWTEVKQLVKQPKGHTR